MYPQGMMRQGSLCLTKLQSRRARMHLSTCLISCYSRGHEGGGHAYAMSAYLKVRYQPGQTAYLPSPITPLLCDTDTTDTSEHTTPPTR